ncbi:MAG TPA: protoglobin domain-containing protein [Myxococcota bacterium]|nr:protoglobin domain-containing protein [Myxococcota bacterium]
MPRSADLEQRLSYLELDARDIERLAALRPVLEKEASRLVDAFYHHLLSYPATRQLLGDAAVRERLLVAQRDYLVSLAGPTLDDAYVEQRRLIGAVHDRIGLEPRWYLGAYALYLSLLVPLVHESHPHDAVEASHTIVSLQKLLFLDAQIAMEAYIDQHERQLQYFTGELAKQGRRLARDFEDQRLELQRTENRARAAEELASVATLVAGLAHEIGTPMGVIQGHANQLEAAVSDDDAKWRLRTIQEQVGRISKIIQTLLNMARPGKTQHVRVSLGSVVDATLGFLTEEFSRRGIAVRTDLDPNASLRGDPERLQQLLLNLLMNAVDAMPNGGELRVALTGDAEAGIEIRVADTGHGISERDLPRIFEPFYTSKEAGTGNGLGLMVAKGIASDHGGCIEVASELGRGTEFRIRFPGAAVRGRAES